MAMPRQARQLPPSAMLHIIARGNNQMRVFETRHDFQRFCKILYRFTHDQDFYLQHYVLMNTHLHLLAWVEDTSKLAGWLKSVFVSYQHYFSKKYQYNGHLWHRRYRSLLIESEEYFLQCARYIELNPVHAGICKRPQHHRWSSYHYHSFGERDPLIQLVIKHGVLDYEWRCSQVNKSYQNFVLAGIDMDYQQLKKTFDR